jgi:hypothetical protein
VRTGRSSDVEQVELDLTDPWTVVLGLVFCRDEEPLLLSVNLEAPMTEEVFDRDAFALALLTSPPAPSVH